MAQLSSPGVSVSVIDESFYTPAAPGTTPLIIVASAENKPNGSGTGTAPGTLSTNAGKVYLMTSQKDLADVFGTPVFKTDSNNNPIHAGEQNEYGLQAAYSYLGVSNRAYVVRAPIDLEQLSARATTPAGPPANGTFWFDTANSLFGLFQWNSSAATVTSGQTFTNKVPLVITSDSQISGGAPLGSLGAVGEYAVVKSENAYSLWYKKGQTSTPAGSWVLVGTESWTASWPTVSGAGSVEELEASDSLTITVDGQGQTFTGHTSLSTLVTDINTANDDSDGAGTGDVDNPNTVPGVSAAIINGRIELYSTGEDITISGNAVPKLGLVSGTYKAPAVEVVPHFNVPSYKRAEHPATVQGRPTGSLWIKTTEPNLGARWRVKVYSEASGSWIEKSAPMYATSVAALKGLDPVGGGINLPSQALYIKHDNADAGIEFKIYARKNSGATIVRSDSTFASNGFLTGANEFTLQYSTKGVDSLSTTYTVSFTALGGSSNVTADADEMIRVLLSVLPAGSPVTASNTDGVVAFSHVNGGEIVFADVTRTPIDRMFTPWNGATGTDNLYSTTGGFTASNWSPYADITASAVAPTTEAVDGQIWYNSLVDEVDIMVHNGTTWVGLQHESSPYYNITDANGPIISATRPTKQSNGSLALATGDLWIDTGDLENYPKLHRFNADSQRWVLVDKADQTTQDGVLFADARWATTGQSETASSISSLLSSNFLDFDAPDPAIYPRGMILWNTRRSGFNVKQFKRDYINIQDDNTRFGDEPMSGSGTLGEEGYVAPYYASRWVSISGTAEDGSGVFGRKAQRKVVVNALKAMVSSNQQIRDDESRIFNLIACPGYPELVSDMVGLNYDRGLTSFVVGDTPARLASDATTLVNWGNNANGATVDGDEGLVSSDEYMGLFYPWGFTSDNLGNNIVVPPSHLMLRTIALNDQVSYQWFAPAGTRRGGITNATAVGYVDEDGEFQSVALNNGQRDTLAAIKVNPITFITGTGLVNYGQYTRARNASSLDRINVARLVIYLRRQFSLLAKPYVFEPNDKITRDEIKGAAENLLLELVGQRAIYDYIVVCDTSNNTPARIDRNELYLDVAIEPVKAVEFIYIPLRLKNTGEIAGL
jgi:hypothetical protein